MLDADGHLRAVDFGFCKVLEGPHGRTYTLCGTPESTAHGLHTVHAQGLLVVIVAVVFLVVFIVSVLFWTQF